MVMEAEALVEGELYHAMKKIRLRRPWNGGR